MARVHPAAVEARTLRLAQKHEAARALLESALAKETKDPDLQIERGLLQCLLQQEDRALVSLEAGKTSSLAPELAQWLLNYGHCRTQLSPKDKTGKVFAEKVSNLFPDLRPNRGARISACLIVKDEERHLDRCLSSLKGHVDEIVVVDTGSTDRTVEIALSHGAKVAEFPWTNDFSAARNISLELASGDWALWIDADEEVTPESWGPIREAIVRPQFGGFFVRIVNFMDEDGDANTYTHAPVRIFQLRPEVRFRGRVHEQVTPSLDEIGLPCAQLTNATLNHYGYRPSDMEAKNKLERTISLLEAEVRESPEDAFHWFNLANAYSVARRNDDAVHAARMCLRFIHPGNSFGTLAYQILASGLNATGKPEEALEVCQQSEVDGHFTILNQFERAHALFKLGRYEDALPTIESAMAMLWDDSMTGDYGIVTHKARTLRGQILSGMGRQEEALADLDAALAVDPNFPIAKLGKASALERSDRTSEAVAIYESLLEDPQYDFAARDALVRISKTTGDWPKVASLSETASKRYPLELGVWANLIGALEVFAPPAERQAAYQAFAEFHDPSADVLVNWSRSLRECGEHEAAYEKLLHAVAAEPENANAHFNLGDLLYSSGLYADAAESYQSGLRHQSDSAEGWFVLGNCFAQMEVWEGAKLAYHQALQLDPEHIGARSNLEYVEGAQKAA